MMAVPNRRTESALTERARAGDTQAFVSLLHRHDRELRGLAFRMLGDAHLMDDVLQEAYTSAYRSLAGFRGEASLRTWLFQIVRNGCPGRLFRRRRGERRRFPLRDAHLRRWAAPRGER